MSDRVDVRAIQALEDLQAELRRFGGEVQAALPNAEHELRRAQEWLHERELYWRREVERARAEVQQTQAALRSCLNQVTYDREGRAHRSSCDAERQRVAVAEARLRRVEAELNTVLHWQRRIELSADEFRRQARRLTELASDEGERARAFLRRSHEHLQRYRAVALLASAAAVLGGSGRVINAVYGQPTKATVGGPRLSTALLQNMPAPPPGALANLKADTWRGLGEAGRRDTLQTLENTLAAAQGRPARLLQVVDTKEGEHGCYDPDTKTIYVSRRDIGADDAVGVSRTLIHEGRHAYQDYAAGNPGVHWDAAQAEAWRVNLLPGNYVDPAHNFPGYWFQPVEVDARQYAQDVLGALFW